MEIEKDIYTNNNNQAFKPWGMEKNQFCMLMHLSQLAVYIIPLAGIVLPIIMWATNKDKSETIDKHGKIILNWLISSTIYIFIGFILSFALIGIPILAAVGVCSLIFITIGAIKANDGIIYKYPLSLTFIK